MKVTQKLAAPFKALARSIAQRYGRGVVANYTVEVASEPAVVKVYEPRATVKAKLMRTVETKKTYDMGVAPLHNTALHWANIRATKCKQKVTLPTGKEITYGLWTRNVPYIYENDNVRAPYPSAWRKDKVYHRVDADGKMYEVKTEELLDSQEQGLYACRDYVNADLKLRLHPELRRIDGGHALNRARLFADATMLEKLVGNGSKSNQLNMALRFYAPVRYVVSPNYPCNFFYHVIKAMDEVMGVDEKKNIQPFLISTSGHAMTLVMKIKQEEDKPSEFSLTFYDPNETYDHMKYTTTDLHSLKNLSFHDFLGSKTTEHLNPRYPFWSIIPVTQDIIDDVMATTEMSPRKQEKIASAQKVVSYTGE